VQAQQTLLTKISQIDPVHVIFSFTEAENLNSRVPWRTALCGCRRTASSTSNSNCRWNEYARAGKVDFTDVRVDPATGTIEGRAVIGNPQGLLRPGQFARTKLSGGVRP
jgi:membrane fusion protein (multidrug efflux system)